MVSSYLELGRNSSWVGRNFVRVIIQANVPGARSRTGDQRGYCPTHHRKTHLTSREQRTQTLGSASPGCAPDIEKNIVYSYIKL